MLVVFEGLPGGGKSKVISALKEQVPELGYNTCQVSTAESCSPVVARLIEIARGHQFGYPERNMLYWVARVHHDAHVAYISSRAQQKDLILVDRLWGSLLAYANLLHFGIGADDPFWTIYPRAFRSQPDLTILLDISVAVARKRKNSPTLLDDGVAEGVRTRYRELARRHFWQTVNAEEPLEDVVKACQALIRQKEHYK